MRKKILGSLAVIAIAAVAAFNVHVNMNEDNVMSALSLANIAALADGEGSVDIPCAIKTGEVCKYDCKDANGNEYTCQTPGMEKV